MHNFLLIISMFGLTSVVAQKRFSEGTISFSVATTVNQEKLTEDGTFVQMIKGGHIRNDLTSSIGSSTTIFDTREGKGAIISEFGSQRILIPLNKENWEDKNAIFNGVRYVLTDETKQLIGFKCYKATAVLNDSSFVEVYYSKEISTENPEVDTPFGTLPGIALQYTYTKYNGNTQVSYIAMSINFDPVPIQKFNIPTSGYRVLSYELSKKGRGN